METTTGMNFTEIPNINTTTEFSLVQGSVLQQGLSLTLTVVISIVMIGVGCGVDFRLLKAHFIRPVGIIIGFLCQFRKCFFLI